MMLHDRGLFDLDDPIEMYLPAFADMRVLREGATSLDETEPAERSVTLRHLLRHTSGLSYGFVEPDSVIDQGYAAAGLGGFDGTLSDLCVLLGGLPLAFQPGTQWRYSFATDVVARLVEVLSGHRFDTFLETSIFAPLGMADTGFYVPPDKHDRFVTMYAGADLLDDTKPGLFKADDPTSGKFSKPRDMLSGGGGLVSTLQDYSHFMQMLIAGGEWEGHRIISEESLLLMRTNQLPKGVDVSPPGWPIPDTMFGLGFGVLEHSGSDDPPGSNGEYFWIGAAGTAAWIAPESGIAGMCFTQRVGAPFHPYIDEFSRFVYESAPQ